MVKLPEDSGLKTNALFCYPRHLIEKRPNDCISILDDVLLLLGGSLNLVPIDRGTDAVVLRADGLAVKVRRLDVTRGMGKEGLVLLYVNSREEGLAPRVYAFTRNVIVMEFIEGISIGRLDLPSMPEEKVRRVVCSSLAKALRLDTLGVDHGQLSRAYDHIILRNEGLDPVFVDFGNASLRRRPRNFASLWSFFYRLGVLRLLNDRISRLDFAKWAKNAPREEVLVYLLDACGRGLSRVNPEPAPAEVLPAVPL